MAIARRMPTTLCVRLACSSGDVAKDPSWLRQSPEQLLLFQGGLWMEDDSDITPRNLALPFVDDASPGECSHKIAQHVANAIADWGQPLSVRGRVVSLP